MNNLIENDSLVGKLLLRQSLLVVIKYILDKTHKGVLTKAYFFLSNLATFV